MKLPFVVLEHRVVADSGVRMSELGQRPTISAVWLFCKYTYQTTRLGLMYESKAVESIIGREMMSSQMNNFSGSIDGLN